MLRELVLDDSSEAISLVKGVDGVVGLVDSVAKHPNKMRYRFYNDYFPLIEY
jgi:hypothetical protein